MTNKAAIYIRVSTHWQVDKDSLQVQRRELISYAELILGITDYEVFEDPGYSAKNTDRPAFQEMMSRLRSGEFSHLLVWKIDRISRNILDFSEMYSEMKKLGIVFVSKNEQFDTSSAIGEAMLKIILVFAELERNMTAERVTSVMVSRAANGQWNGGRVPFGYKYDKETDSFSADEKTAPIYHLIVSLYEELNSSVRVSDELNKRGIPAPSSAKWSPTSVYRILTNQFYIGDYIYNKYDEDGTTFTKRPKSEWIVIHDHHPALIEESKFNHIQYILKSNSRSSRKPGDTYQKVHVHIFGGLVRCAACGGNYIATYARRRKDGWRPSIYNCTTRRNNKTECQNPAVGDYVLGPFCFQLISNILTARNKIKKNTTAESFTATLTYNLGYSIDPNDAKAYLSYMKKLKAENQPSENTFTYQGKINTIDEEMVIQNELHKNELALNRLRQLYLYSEKGMSEEEYLIEQRKITEDQKRLEKRMSALQEQAQLRDDVELTRKASYLVMLKMLENPDRIDYKKFATAADPTIPKSFLVSIISHINVLNGAVSSITFRNGLELRVSKI